MMSYVDYISVSNHSLYKQPSQIFVNKASCKLKLITVESYELTGIYQCFYRDRLVIPECKQNMTALRGQASFSKMMPLGGKLTALECHPTKYVNKAD